MGPVIRARIGAEIPKYLEMRGINPNFAFLKSDPGNPEAQTQKTVRPNPYNL
jgi:hypothetical protein